MFGLLSYRNREQAKGTELLAQATVVLNTAVVPVNAETKPGDAPAAAGIGAKGTFSTETQKLNAAVPKLRAAADAYPDTAAGIQARYHLAASLAALGQQKEAITQFDDVVRRAGTDSLYGRMAQLGKADAQFSSGQTDGAIATCCASWRSAPTRSRAS